MIKHILLILSLTFTTSKGISQKRIQFNNPSFEELTKPIRFGGAAKNWYDMGKEKFPDQSPYDIQPGYFGVKMEPKDGEKYIGMVTRPNGSYEGIGQELTETLQKGMHYYFTLHVAQSQNLSSPLVFGKDSIHRFNNPVRLVISIKKIGSEETYCIYKSAPITSDKWQKLRVEFTPKFDADYIIFEVLFKDENNFLAGNLLLDALNLKQNTSINSYAEYKLLDELMLMKTQISHSERLLPLNLIHQLIIRRDDIYHYLLNLTDYEFNQLRLGLERIKATQHISIIDDFRNTKKRSNTQPIKELDKQLKSTFDQSEEKIPLFRLLIEHISDYRNQIINEILEIKNY